MRWHWFGKWPVLLEKRTEIENTTRKSALRLLASVIKHILKKRKYEQN